MTESYGGDGNPSWDLDRVSHAGPEASSKISAALMLYGFLRSRGRGRWSAFWSAIEELRHAIADKNSQGGEVCARFDIMDQLLGAAYVPKGNRTTEEKVRIARASWPTMSPRDKEYERQALNESKK